MSVDARKAWVMLAVVWFIVGFVIAIAHGEEIRTWTDNTGKHKTEASFKSYKDNVITLVRADGKEIVLPVARLSVADVDYARSHSASLREKKLADLRQSHTTWRVKVQTITTHKEPVYNYSTHRVMPGVNQTVPTGVDHYVTVQDKHYVMQAVTGTLVSYQRTDVVIEVQGKSITFDSRRMADTDQRFLSDYRKAEKGE